MSFLESCSEGNSKVLLHSALSTKPCDFWQAPKIFIANCIFWLFVYFMNTTSLIWSDCSRCLTPLAPSRLVNSALSRCKLVMYCKSRVLLKLALRLLGCFLGHPNHWVKFLQAWVWGQFHCAVCTHWSWVSNCIMKAWLLGTRACSPWHYLWAVHMSSCR